MENPVGVDEIGPARPVPDLTGAEAREIQLAFGRDPVRLIARYDALTSRWELEGRGHVGSITLSTGRTIRIATKVPIDTLLYMLSYATSGFNFFDPASAFDKTEDFFEIVVREFALRTSELLRLGLHQGYIEEEDDRLRALRGRLLVGTQIRRNFVNRDRFACRFVELTPDLPMNRALRLATFLASHFAYRHTSTKDQLEANLRLFGGVSLTTMEPSVALGLADQLDRLTENHRIPLFLAALIIASVTLEDTVGGISFSSYLVDMKTVFQQYVASALREELRGQGIRVVAQRHRDLDAGGLLEFIPDIELWREDSCLVIADTKYKRYELNADGSGGPGSGDVHQALVYGAALHTQKRVLLYPTDVAAVFQKVAGMADIYVLGIDLSGSPADLRARMKALATKLLDGVAIPVAA